MIFIQNLGLIVTNKCNIDCKHCSRGCKNNNDMKKEVIDKVLEECKYIGNLCLLGGEITLSTEILEYLFNKIIENRIIVQEMTTVINGTNYSEEFLRLLDYLNNYIESYMNKGSSNTTFTLSLDKYHLEEIKRLNMEDSYKESMRRYSSSIHFYGYQILKPNKKLLREGNAALLDKNITVPLRHSNYYVTYAGKEKLCNVGPIVCINTNGIYTECDASIKSQEDVFNYGNVLDTSIEEFAKTYGKVVRPFMWNIKTNLETKKYQSYNK